ncbi:protein GrpE [Moorella thermoacetica]|uniref:Protein GrpE n=1 Tax=Neomoorella thermoacetica TaxID=1525 RepID=A0A1J5PCV9_NEOTH|nr:protein GrpE [Moorella thermoacetica]
MNDDMTCPEPEPGTAAPEATGAGINGEEPVSPEGGTGPEQAEAMGAAGETVNLTEEINSLRAEVENKTAALAELQQRYLRLQADFDNYRKRTRREQEELIRMAAARLITSLLPVLDNLERALAAATDNKAEGLATGVEMTLRQLKEILAQEGLTTVAALGQPFNPELHEAVAMEETEDPEQANLVVAELRRGYILKGKLLRPAMVKVAVAGATVKENGQEVDKDE